MNDIKRQRYEYDPDEEFFVDNSKPNEDDMGEELLTEEVVALLNAGDTAQARVEALVNLARSYEKSVDDRCAETGCTCTFPGREPCSAFISRVLEETK
jgi:hypothetical protein